MTVRLLVPYGRQGKNTLLSTGAAEETRLLNEGLADTNTSLGVVYVPPVPTDRSGPPSVETTAGVDSLIADGRTILDISAAQALVGGDVLARSADRHRVVVAGDSNTARNSNKTAANPTVSGVIGGNLVTCTLVGHGRYAGDTIQIGNYVDVAYNGVFTVETRIDVDNVTYRSAIPLTTTNGGGGAGEARQPSQFGSNSSFAYLNGLLGGMLELVRNAGNTGERVEQLAARYDRDVLSYNPDLTHNAIGINNIRADESALTIWAKLEPLMDRSKASCPLNVWETVFNHAAASGSFTPARTTEILALNQLIINKCAADTTGRLVCSDVFNALVDRGVATLPTRAEYIEDNDIHLSAFGARVKAQPTAEILRIRLPKVDPFPSLPEQASGITANYTLNNPLMFPGTPVAGVGTVSGPIAAGWRVDGIATAAVVCSLVPRTIERDGDQCGFNQRLAITFAAANDAVQFRQTNMQARLVAGGTYLFGLILRTKDLPSDLKDLRPTFNFTADGIAYSCGMQAQTNNDGTTSKLSNLDDVLAFVSRPIRIPVNAAAITVGEFFLYCRGAGAGVFTIEAGRALHQRIS